MFVFVLILLPAVSLGCYLIIKLYCQFLQPIDVLFVSNKLPNYALSLRAQKSCVVVIAQAKAFSRPNAQPITTQ